MSDSDTKWAGFEVSSTEYHVVPLNDQVEHELDGSCVCLPVPNLTKNAVSADTWVYLHSSLDGRELREGNRNG